MTYQQTIAFLNELIALDAQAITALVESRVPCNKSLADHPSVQVSSTTGGGYSVGLLGILNGLFGTREDGWGFISAVFDDNGVITEFKETER
jgi:hypothetical protein